VIPRTAHFVWLGTELPWVHSLSVASAALSGGFERVVLHHTDVLDGSPHACALSLLDRVILERLDPETLLADAGAGDLIPTYRSLPTPAGKSNLIRVALLAVHGGVYLDMDTITVRDFGRLCERGGVFLGEERLVFPATSGGGLPPVLRPTALLRTLVRDVLRRHPSGYRQFGRIERYYPRAVNNAVLGAEPRHPFFAALLARVRELPSPERLVRYALGTHLFQRAVVEAPTADLSVLEPSTFYPLGPEISEHWFRMRRRAALEDVVKPETVLVHWYASVRTRRHVALLDPEFVRRHSAQQLFSSLASPVVEALSSGVLVRRL
jgi:hypothetical protein